MSNYDVQYANLVKDIIENGVWDKDQNVRTKWADGSSAYTKSLISRQLTFDNTEVPILTTKRVAWITAIKELLWIWQKKDNNVDNLNDMGVHIWDEWKQKDGTIGKAYGYQMGKKCRLKLGVDTSNGSPQPYVERLDQVQYLIWQLKTNPSSRRHLTTLWNIDDLDEMSLTPCVFLTQWLVKEGKLHLIVQVRSNDIALGNPFNIFQYYVLQRMIAQVTNHELGTLTFNINDAHIYERHLEPLQEQVEREPFEAPTLWINPNVKNFDDFTIDDFKLIDYKYHPKIEMEVAI
ncbi:thymidylate synthase [Paenibacillus alvei]|uniref:thymidylate synthase n=1 Tax=Paenibacillus alvei TaxID=44250 RepID=UPI00228147AE|nr:thymidylate synthase [Paenibacillus alvei]MCY9737505.1 thymidylate synthase [Paenibacillus alvei]